MQLCVSGELLQDLIAGTLISLTLCALFLQANDFSAAVRHLGGDQRRPHGVHDEHAGRVLGPHPVLDIRSLPMGLLHPAG